MTEKRKKRVIVDQSQMHWVYELRPEFAVVPVVVLFVLLIVILV